MINIYELFIHCRVPSILTYLVRDLAWRLSANPLLKSSKTYLLGAHVTKAALRAAFVSLTLQECRTLRVGCT